MKTLALLGLILAGAIAITFVDGMIGYKVAPEVAHWSSVAHNVAEMLWGGIFGWFVIVKWIPTVLR